MLTLPTEKHDYIETLDKGMSFGTITVWLDNNTLIYLHNMFTHLKTGSACSDMFSFTTHTPTTL